MVPRPEIPQLSRCLIEKEKIDAEGKIMTDMVLQGQRVDVLSNPLQQKQFVDEQLKKRGKNVVERNRWILVRK